MRKTYIARRDFLRGAAVGALGLAATSLAACGSASSSTAASSSAAAAGSYTPGTYTATVKGYSSYITVEMTFDESSITACSVNAAGETPEIGTKAAEELASLIVSDQSVDATTTATADITLPAVRKAANNCIQQAQGKAVALNENAGDTGDDWLGEAPEIDASQISATQDTELLIIGAGNGGMMAAVTAADAGMDFIVCEQNQTMGDTRHWIGAVDTDAQKAAGVTIQKDRLLNELARYASYKCDMDVIKMWIQNSAEMVSYLESLGMRPSVHIAPETHVGGNNMEYYVPSLWHTVDLPEGSEAKDRHAFLEQYINEKGYEIQYGMTLVRLVQDASGKVTGAIFSDETGAYVQVNAENVILATGGYPGNPKMVKALAPIINECVTANSYFGPDAGMGIRAGIWAGAKRDTECAPMIFDRGIVAPGVKAGYVEDENGNLAFPGTVGQFNLGTQPHLKVNKEGLRFANESCPYDFLNYAASLQTDGVYAAIMDCKVEENVIAYDQYGCAQIAVDMAKGGALMPALEQQVEAGLAFKADTIEELAEKLGLPVDTLVATVDRYNELCAKGVDEDFGKEAYRMRPITEPPFYGYFMGGSLLTTCDGLRINRKCQVYDQNHKVIEGLYCVGDCSGSFFSGNYPEYFVGVAVGRTMTQGRYAVKAILGETV
ncbi:FAD-binding protein [Faecalibacterium gallinarum]|uniref:Urocanate reductase n=1 Tax=Faecalibacterium gallinarum TaxID=2903556 RepID=A0AA37MZ41_9FIRM|nr:FAD-binding protein [Faecalibacterium gallinarum]GJN65596.1 FAD-binding dehydrogenase [Faecalibacterium gallinarum]